MGRTLERRDPGTARAFVTRRLPGDALDRIPAAGHELDLWAGALPPGPDELRDRAAAADGLLCLLTDTVDDQLLAAAPRLRVVSTYAVGTDHIELDACVRRGVAVGATPAVLTDATADLTLALILAAARHLPAARDAVRDGSWRTWEPAGHLGLELREARLAVVGPGRIGSAVARRARAFGMDVTLVGRDDDLLAQLARAHVVSLHVPLTADTRHLIGARALAAMRPGAILVNTARGGLVDHDALLCALDAGSLGAAALDVTDPEPLPADHPLATHPRALVLPHIGSATTVARERMAHAAVDNLLAGLAGEPLPHPAGRLP